MMKKYCKWLALLLALILSFSALAACSGGDDQQTPDGGGKTDAVPESAATGEDASTAPSGGVDTTKDTTLTVGLMSPNGTMDITADNAPRYQMRTVFESLFRQNPETMEIEPWLATSAEWKDELTLEIHLRDDVYFTGGQHFTSKDAFYCLRDIWAAGMQGSYFLAFDWDNSTIPDDETIIFRFTQPYGPVLVNLATYAIGCYDDLWGDDPADADKWMLSPNGTGPYYCTENVASSYCTFVRKDADDYWGELPECSEVTYRYYSESATMYIDFENGVLDAACAISTQDAERVLAGDCPDFTAYDVNSIRDVMMVILPEEVAVFDDIRVREAFFKAIDGDSVALAMYGPLFLPADSIIASDVKYYVPQEKVAYDPEGAKALLAEAGYPDGIDLHYIVTQDQQVLQEALQASLATAGFRVTCESYDVPTAVPMLREMKSDFITKQAEGGAFIADPVLVLDTMSPESTLPPAGMQDEVWADAFHRAIYTTSEEERAAAYAELQAWAAEEYRVYPLCARANMLVYNGDKLESFHLNCADEPIAQYAKFR